MPMIKSLLFNGRHWRQRAMLALLAVFLVSTPATLAQGLPQLTSEQQRALSAMTPAQKEAVLRQMGFTNARSVPAPTNRTDRAAEIEIPTSSVIEEGESLIDTLDVTDTIILILSPRENVRLDRKTRSLKERINSGNPYRLDSGGQLTLPELPKIALGGLSQQQAQVRMQAEPAFSQFDLEFHILPIDDPEGPTLEPFGYNVFSDDPRRFGVGDSVPVPSDYKIGPGDMVRIQFYGAAAAQYALEVDRDGMLSLPQLGPLQAAGLSFDGLREEIRLRVSQQLIGSEVSVTLGQLRSVRVFLVGDVVAPGAYQVNAFATISNVLALGGGVAESGSLRRIQQKRDGRVINTFDLYRLLLHGDAARDRRVADGDVLFVPPVGSRVSIAGEVQRPAKYEFIKSLSVAEAVKMAGGALPGALRSDVRVERQSAEDGLNVYEVDLDRSADAGFALASGDRLTLVRQSNQLDQAVTLQGHVYRPGVEPWSPGMRLSQLLSSPRDVKSQADLGYVLIQRQRVPNGPIEVLSADLGGIWARSARAADPELQARDQITVFSMTEERDVYLQPILETLRLQAQASAPTAVVSVDGQVKRPGTYPLEAGMTVIDLIRAGGGLTESAYRDSAELRRYGNDSGGERVSDLLDISLLDLSPGTGSAGELLQRFDHLSVKGISNWGEDNFLELRGEILFPGRYSVRRGETLASVLRRAGGLSDTAFPEGTILIRESLREREREQLDELAARIESDLASMALSNSGQSDAIGIGQSLLRQIRATDPTGRLVIDMSAILSGDRNADVLVRDGDSLFVPKKSQEITVVGEVQYATSHLWKDGLVRDDYIVRSGGITAKADRRRIYIVRASGEVVVSSRSRFYSRSQGNDIEAGDTIVVPLKTDRVAPLVLWSSATQIIYNLAIAAAAVGSF
ncbi:MAG: SLBB domain-containing protein [Gammaproteobacteria bacterium]